ncbi:DHHC zinc finger domain containing protein [Trichomonas vaginalis G3]|uniref:Palmitoyltransferase n=1 Tax=Trichomonas vaginalis (strain ATCC PRA-98 / G3) TaxID=412133 RepID=A2EAK0_TRIV3|nr:palmitoyltransferase ZDHHC24-related family [Trichomonas vaginalis G3]EAY10311.1 DHHC zinc finger domain containing protein [Trichomonas vaginalis G3]KAI5491028.1 palmitoyltransferase ZDHHC24-related family [Trichomonas vaginalis G3]|eukprot:XP_001322534.1 DHHC zinc finger domain containing protein [Trichomonas vaginalis G3]
MDPELYQTWSNYETNWEDRSNCCCNVAYFPDGDFTIVQHFIKNITKPILVTLVSILTFINLAYDIYFSTKSLKQLIILEIVSLIIYLCFFFSYWILIVRGPGYIPYNWSVRKLKSYPWRLMMNSIAIYSQQEHFARMSDRPYRASFSVTARRFVLRADHICLWTNSWVGLNNQRYFILLTFWVVIYGLCWFLLRWNWYFVIFRPFKFHQVFALVIAPFFLYMMGFALHHFRHAFINAIHNKTIIEKHNKRNTDDFNRGCLNNFEEICGSKYLMFLWPIPCVCLQPKGDGLYQQTI